jgi:hypothetical protein
VRPNEIRALRYAMQALDIDRLRRCQMNTNNAAETIDFNKVTFIDKAPKKIKTAQLQDPAIQKFHDQKPLVL